jgi:hypothetical protein
MFDYTMNIVSKQSVANDCGFAFVQNDYFIGDFYYFLHNGIYIADVSKLLWTGFFKGKRQRPIKDLSTEEQAPS